MAPEAAGSIPVIHPIPAEYSDPNTVMMRRHFAAIAFVACAALALPGVWPFALADVSLAAGAGDGWRAHRTPAAPLATAAQRANHDTGRPSRIAIGVPTAPALLAPAFAATGVARVDGEGSHLTRRFAPVAGRSPPA